MPISFLPPLGTVLLCDYTTGFLPPEMVKTRPVVVVSPRSRRQAIPATQLIVPFSTKAPQMQEAFHVEIPAGAYPFLKGGVSSWVKCDHPRGRIIHPPESAAWVVWSALADASWSAHKADSGGDSSRTRPGHVDSPAIAAVSLCHDNPINRDWLFGSPGFAFTPREPSAFVDGKRSLGSSSPSSKMPARS